MQLVSMARGDYAHGGVSADSGGLLWDSVISSKVGLAESGVAAVEEGGEVFPTVAALAREMPANSPAFSGKLSNLGWLRIVLSIFMFIL